MFPLLKPKPTHLYKCCILNEAIFFTLQNHLFLSPLFLVRQKETGVTINTESNNQHQTLLLYHQYSFTSHKKNQFFFQFLVQSNIVSGPWTQFPKLWVFVFITQLSLAHSRPLTVYVPPTRISHTRHANLVFMKNVIDGLRSKNLSIYNQSSFILLQR